MRKMSIAEYEWQMCQMGAEEEEAYEKESTHKHSLNRHFLTPLHTFRAVHTAMFRRLLLHTNFSVKHIKSVHTKPSVVQYLRSNFYLPLRKMSTSAGEVVIGTHSGIFHCKQFESREMRYSADY